MDNLEIMAELLERHKEFRELQRRLRMMSAGNPVDDMCNVIEFNSPSFYTKVDDKELIGELIDRALLFLNEKIKANEMLMGLADMAIKRILEENE